MGSRSSACSMMLARCHAEHERGAWAVWGASRRPPARPLATLRGDNRFGGADVLVRPAAQSAADAVLGGRGRPPLRFYFVVTAAIGDSFTVLLNAGRSVSQIAFSFASSASICVTSSSRTAICCAVGACAPVAAESPTPESLSLRRIGKLSGSSGEWFFV